MLCGMTIVVLLLLILGDAILAIVTGFVARARGRRFWLWALIGVVLPLVALVVVLVLPKGRRGILR
jgi:hypothetical protein